MWRPTNQPWNIDSAHELLNIFEEPITNYAWQAKYRYNDEAHPNVTFGRVCDGVYKYDTNVEAREMAYGAMCKGLWVPGGRILAGAGTDKHVTMINCFVDRTIEDSMNGIADALKDAMLTMQQGGGIGMDFSTLRPTGAHLNRTGAIASGPLPFMDMWDSMCRTIMSAGARRGAMMGTMHCEHPDLLNFIDAKSEQGRLTNFNVSVLVTDAFMDAVANDEEWHLGFGVPRSDGNHLFTVDREDVDGGVWYVYSEHRARELWDRIIQHTYEYSEPGVIFIDRVNDRNNLNYCETIMCTNPCGEQPLPPNGACNLGAVNLARMVHKPFTTSAKFDWKTLSHVVQHGMRFLDNVIDTAIYPLEEQQAEEYAKRRTGLGVTGLHNAMIQLGIRYGSEESLHFTGRIMEVVKNSAYQASAWLAAERGTFPLYNQDRWGDNELVRGLAQPVKDLIYEQGIRNGVLLTIAPTGTTSLLMGNVSSGLEPTFEFRAMRNVRAQDESIEQHIVEDYAYKLYKTLRNGSEPSGDEWISAQDLTVKDHVRMQSVCQQHIDASISKTINCPVEMSFEEFKLTYWDAYELGCKGCTTYRPSATRGSVLSVIQETQEEEEKVEQLVDRPSSLSGNTYKLKWGTTAYYLTINNLDNKPFEIFISSTSGKYTDWQTALSLMVSAVMRKGGNIDFIPEELKKVVSVTDYAWVQGTFYGSLVALIGHTLEHHIEQLNSSDDGSTEDGALPEPNEPKVAIDEGGKVLGEFIEAPEAMFGEFCPQCNNPTLHSREGCKSCVSCGYSNCG